MTPRALLVHSSNWLGVSRLPGLIRKAGVRVDVSAAPASLLASNRYVDELLPSGADPDAQLRAVRARLARDPDRYAMIVLTDDPLLAAARRLGDDPILRRCLPVEPDHPLADALSSKFAFLAAARSAGLPVAASSIAHGADAFAAADAIGYPVMAKLDVGAGGNGVRLAHDRAELARAIAEFRGAPIAVEAYVEGLVGATELLYKRGTVYGRASFVKVQRFPTDFGPSSVRRIFEPPQLAEAAERIGALTGYTGFAALCWIYDPARERLALLELNPRNGSGMHLRPAFARTFAPAIRAFVRDQPPAAPFVANADGRLYRMFPQDLTRAVARRDVGGMLAWFPFVPSARDLPWGDSRLLAGGIREVITTCFPHATTRLRSAARAVRRPA